MAKSITATKRKQGTTTVPYDVADHLRNVDEMAAYLDAWLSEALVPFVVIKTLRRQAKKSNVCGDALVFFPPS
jgi:hypothetical protein